ncbi:Signal transduction histidine kinase [Paucidesulfovibrio gracilis DSM 16080]|uniref:histidine kinase n=1 Tax=Paucidesulfovibrio gracilis DSM 16080 TaxID=1121449 RepID=A0A1T4X4C3_9BACT|nr:ATP-binding protein [Paucidesulfovibrio gracilis]SKA84452.1 Signal transduction histidine kinase [Paucidesulfovibrio gracilis DSM 16080]
MQERALAAGAVFQCDSYGHVERVLADGLGLFHNRPASFFSLLDLGSQPKFHSFLNTLNAHGAALSWEMNVLTGNGATPMTFFGLRSSDSLFCIVSRSPDNLFTLYDDLLAMLNEQAALLRDAQQRKGNGHEEEDRMLTDFMQLNNELVNARRELTLKNQEVERQEQRLRRVLNSIPDAVFVVDRQGKVLFSNPVAVCLFDGCPELGKRWLPMIHECGDEPREICMLTEGDNVTLELRVSTLDWEGEPAYLVSMRDVSERRKLEMVREDMERITHHDIKSPLSGIISLAAMSREDEGLTPELRQQLGMIENAGYRVLKMVNMSLDLYKMEQGNYTFHNEDVDLIPIVFRTLDDKRPMLRARGVQTHVRLNGTAVQSGDALVIRAEETLCYSMLANLVANAVEASPDDGSVEVDMTAGRTQVCIDIANQGAVPEEIRHRFFEKYVTLGKRSGTGIGTYSARLIAKTLGGDVIMRTDDQTGTVVSVRLPWGVEDAPADGA